ncbi:hypothetical protein OGAPHI_002691 [Ogataea philodendri]|uniref:PH domain-containing protein n=1 Tax=Ogataea philodendri TaxID=1378263 RepID=A0A9P8PBW1_9ASCO|nr:uncharacterized protein OGAPHI_002691 [Ogataea philodendri]KAH3668936.1 hypothetical protein OGAPHI_002691 [Ogataea philodendri]
MDLSAHTHRVPIIDIPANSFTAFKIRYDTATGLNRRTTIESLGPIPKQWVVHKQSTVLSAIHNISNKGNASQRRYSEMFDHVARNFGFRSTETQSSPTSSTSEETRSVDATQSLHSDESTVNNSSSTEYQNEPVSSLPIRNHAGTEDHPSTPSLYRFYNRKSSTYREPSRTLGWSNDEFLAFQKKLTSRVGSGSFRQTAPRESSYSYNRLSNDIDRARILGHEARNIGWGSTSSSTGASFVTANEYIPDQSNGFDPNLSESEQAQTSNETTLASADTVIELPKQNKVSLPAAHVVKSVTFSPSIKKKSAKNKPNPFKVQMLEPKEHISENQRSSSIQHHSVFGDIYEQVNEEMVSIFHRLQHRTVGARHRINSEYSKIDQRRRLKRMFQEFSAGNIVKMEKMLVTVIMNETNSGSESSTRVFEKWKEYIVVARSTGNHEYPIILQFFKKRNILSVDYNGIEQLDSDDSSSEDDDMKNESISTSNHLQFDVLLSTKDTCVRFRNVLDKTISISKLTKKRRSLEYILLPQTQSSAIRWLSFFSTILKDHPKKKHKTMLLNIPDIDISLTVKNLAHYLTPEDFQLHDGEFKVEYLNIGYGVPRINAFNKLVDMIISQLSAVDNKAGLSDKTAHFIQKVANQRHLLAFAAKKYDRLEWILGENEKLLQAAWMILNDTHDIELREIKHEPHMLSNEPLLEPTPIEGFLAQLSNRKGKTQSTFGRNYYKIRYFSTFDNVLMFQDFYNAVPAFPQPMREVINPLGQVLDNDVLKDRIHERPIRFKKSAFPLEPEDHTHISWLKPGVTLEEFRNHDMDALYDAERRATTIMNCKSIVDLCNVSEIRNVTIDDIPHMVRLAGSVTWGWEQGHLDDEQFVDSCFELILKTGSRIRVQASTQKMRDEWVFRLQQLVEYWTKRKAEDLDRVMGLREKNMQLANLPDDKYESILTAEEEPSKWELSKATSDPLIYNISSWSIDKPLIMSGLLYQKRKKHKSFKKYFVLLCPGFLKLFELFERSVKSGTVKPTAYYKHYTSISLANCYVFCDSTNDLNISGHDATLSRVIPGSHLVPRIYADGWMSSEDENSRHFTLWFGSKRVMLKQMNLHNTVISDLDHEMYPKDGPIQEPVDKKVTMEDRGKMLKTVSRLGVTGRSMVFLARSRVERDLWVTKMLNEIERFNFGDEEEIQLS